MSNHDANIGRTLGHLLAVADQINIAANGSDPLKCNLVKSRLQGLRHNVHGALSEITRYAVDTWLPRVEHVDPALAEALGNHYDNAVAAFDLAVSKSPSSKIPRLSAEAASSMMFTFTASKYAFGDEAA